MGLGDLNHDHAGLGQRRLARIVDRLRLAEQDCWVFHLTPPRRTRRSRRYAMVRIGSATGSKPLEIFQQKIYWSLTISPDGARWRGGSGCAPKAPLWMQRQILRPGSVVPPRMRRAVSPAQSATPPRS